MTGMSPRPWGHCTERSSSRQGQLDTLRRLVILWSDTPRTPALLNVLARRRHQPNMRQLPVMACQVQERPGRDRHQQEEDDGDPDELVGGRMPPDDGRQEEHQRGTPRSPRDPERVVRLMQLLDRRRAPRQGLVTFLERPQKRLGQLMVDIGRELAARAQDGDELVTEFLMSGCHGPPPTAEG